jgi:hypothetical protein
MDPWPGNKGCSLFLSQSLPQSFVEWEWREKEGRWWHKWVSLHLSPDWPDVSVLGVSINKKIGGGEGGDSGFLRGVLRFNHGVFLIWILNGEFHYERLESKDEGSTRLGYTGLSGGLEHLKIETRLIDERFTSVIRVCETVCVPEQYQSCLFVYYKWRKRELYAKLVNWIEEF